ncbi:MAG TPA: alanine racemase [Candidatus Limnocylindria bacterium]|nr:alanine racemase [Candidatus Limnocylindria bacterium]
MSALAPLRTTVVDVDLDAIVDNFDALRRRAENAEVIAVVKADGYGHGVEAIAETLAGAGAAMLAVVTAEEAMTIRAAGIRAPVLVLVGGSERPEIEAAIAADCAMVVWDVDHARLIDELAASAGRRAAVHFKVDTGLTRLGAPLGEAVARYRAIQGLRHIAVEGVMTHFATADDPDPAIARSQFARFSEFLDAAGTLPRFVHAAASAGVAAFGALDRCTAIRPGISLYGLHAAAHQAVALPLRPALTWRSRVRRVAAAAKGTGVSYGHAYRLPRDGRIATVPVGYGDGLPRMLGGRGRMLVGGRALPFAGRICMDLVMLDVTDLPAVKEGDEVVVIGTQGAATQTADDLAAALGTVNYEIVTGIRRRVPRRYHRGGRVVAQRTLVDGYVRL